MVSANLIRGVSIGLSRPDNPFFEALQWGAKSKPGQYRNQKSVLVFSQSISTGWSWHLRLRLKKVLGFLSLGFLRFSHVFFHHIKIYLGQPPLLRFFILLEAGVNLAEALLHEEVFIFEN
jgi:hypothetical protein